MGVGVVDKQKFWINFPKEDAQIENENILIIISIRNIPIKTIIRYNYYIYSPSDRMAELKSLTIPSVIFTWNNYSKTNRKGKVCSNFEKLISIFIKLNLL